ncbi:MAG: triose-phosphate isomerase [Alphaproteobacteria bacterium]|nr:triose-phosphate isomerase [Alphaproteobacteria bacterium]
MMARTPLICGNWKMNLGPHAARDLARAIVHGLPEVPFGVAMAVCPSTPCLQAVLDEIRVFDRLEGGAQDCHAALSGAHTGDTSVEALRELGCAYVIVGHSERRADHAESDATVKAKAATAQAAGLTPIVCVGETLAQREAGEAEAVVAAQVKGSLPDGVAGDGVEGHGVVVAYEPVWAIGTGKVASPADVDAMHRAIRATLAGMMADADKVRLLYGGSVKPENAAELLALDDVDGALVGGASLKADSFLAIAKAAKTTG